ncbi:MAG TPA: efflux RND transporter periplasmic adaptor subunit [Sedimentisphaerales bacterium]|nr:efflux RND transporter periplasmic adaptor subunit [Sedimentisphaerales bacterium]
MNTGKSPDSDIAKALGTDQSSSHRSRLKRWFLIGIPAVMIVTAIVIWTKTGTSNSVQFKTEEVRRGDITVIVTATGTLQPTNEVDVGSELSGIIETVEVDYNNKVEVGQVLARLDTSKLDAQVTQSKAALESAKAKVLQTQATLSETRSKLAQFERVRELSNKKVPSQAEFDAAEAAFERAKADVASATAAVSQAQAALEAYKTDLSKTVIRSPVNGIVLTRSVEPGQTVAAAFQAPVLFTLAEDLTQMELHVNVDEADVGKVKEGQDAEFSVDAYPNRTFKAQITQTRYGAQTVEGVVTYETLLKVDNADLSLRPGMTATADIIVTKIENAVLVSNSALRFKLSTEDDRKNNGGLVGALLPHPPRHKSKQTENAISSSNRQQVWVLKDGKDGRPVAVPVTTGATDGVMTEILDGEIEPGMLLVVDVISKGSGYGPVRADG